MFGDLFDMASRTVERAIDDPLGTAVDAVTSPIVNAADVLDGLTEGELRHKAALRLGADVVAGMALNEVIEYLTDA